MAQQLAALVQNSDEPPAHDHVQQTYNYEALVAGRLERCTCIVSMKSDTVALWRFGVVPFLQTGKVGDAGTRIATWCSFQWAQRTSCRTPAACERAIGSMLTWF